MIVTDTSNPAHCPACGKQTSYHERTILGLYREAYCEDNECLSAVIRSVWAAEGYAVKLDSSWGNLRIVGWERLRMEVA